MTGFVRLGPLVDPTSIEPRMAREFAQAKLPPGGSFAAFPPKEFLGSDGVFAYRLFFMVSTEDGERVLNELRSELSILGHNPSKRGRGRTRDGSARFIIRDDYGGVVVTLITNSFGLLDRIDALRLQTPPPWLVFPYLRPDPNLALPDHVAVWWLDFWHPFWNAAGTHERSQYLLKNPASPEWIEFARCRD